MTTVPTRTSTRGAQSLLSMPVYSIADGKLLGNIDRLFVNIAERSVPLIRIGKSLSTWHAFIPFAAIRTLGVDIVLVDSEATLREQMSDEESQVLATSLTGRPIVTQSGERIGQLGDFSIANVTGRITEIRMEPNTGVLQRLTSLGRHDIEVPDPLIHAFGKDAIIVHDTVKEMEG